MSYSVCFILEWAVLVHVSDMKLGMEYTAPLNKGGEAVVFSCVFFCDVGRCVLCVLSSVSALRGVG